MKTLLGAKTAILIIVEIDSSEKSSRKAKLKRNALSVTQLILMRLNANVKKQTVLLQYGFLIIGSGLGIQKDMKVIFV